MDLNDKDKELLIKDALQIHIGSISSKYLGKCVRIKGTVIQISDKKEVCTLLVFKCCKCERVFSISQINGYFKEPSSCEDTECTGRRFDILENNEKVKFIVQRKIKIQENEWTSSTTSTAISNQASTSNTNDPAIGSVSIFKPELVSGSVECILKNTLVDCCSAGDTLIITGIIQINEVSEQKKRVDTNLHAMYLEALEVRNEKTSTTDERNEINFSAKDLEEIMEVEKYKDELFRLLVHSIAPGIYGYEIVKAGLLLCLFSGSSKPSDDKKSFKRNNIHALIVGDPGMGKSQLLKTIKEVSPRGVYLSGGTTTVTGLTVTMIKDSDADHGYTLEPGALMLADEGVCCIDEFDKMRANHPALLEAMEQQSISIAKAGMFRTFFARSTVIAAANPVDGHYDERISLAENIKLHAAILSRFDLIFLLKDNPNKDMDLRMSEYLLEVDGGIKLFRDESFDNSPEDLLPLCQKLKYKKNEDVSIIELLPITLLRKYISYAKENVNPKLSKEAGECLKTYYLKLRSRPESTDTIQVTVRLFESLIRLTEARAKLELRSIATLRDAQEIIEIYEYSNSVIITNNESNNDNISSGNIAKRPRLVDQSSTSLSTKKTADMNERKKFLSAIKSASDRQQKKLFSIDELKEIGNSIGISKTQKIIDNLNNEGYLLKKGNNVYQLINYN